MRVATAENLKFLNLVREKVKDVPMFWAVTLVRLPAGVVSPVALLTPALAPRAWPGCVGGGRQGGAQVPRGRGAHPGLEGPARVRDCFRECLGRLASMAWQLAFVAQLLAYDALAWLRTSDSRLSPGLPPPRTVLHSHSLGPSTLSARAHTSTSRRTRTLPTRSCARSTRSPRALPPRPPTAPSPTRCAPLRLTTLSQA